MIYGVGLSPNRRASFVSMFYFGEGEMETIRDLYASKIDELTMSYGPIDAFPERMMKEAQWGAQVALPFNQFGTGNFQSDSQAKGSDVPKMLLEQQRFDHPQITDLQLSNVNGTIVVEGWKRRWYCTRNYLTSPNGNGGGGKTTDRRCPPRRSSCAENV